MNTEFIVDFQCLQCGAPAELKETTRLFACQYCGVKSYLVPRGEFQYVLPSRVPQGLETIYFPYWHVKGVIFVCDGSLSIGSAVVNEILQATPSEYFPPDLGFKAQVMKVTFPGSETKGQIFYPDTTRDEVIDFIKSEYPSGYHSEFIGFTDIIYAPFYIQDETLYDGISRKRVDKYWDVDIEVTREMVDDLGPAEKLQQDLKFIPTLCPNCGWDMDCAEDSFLLGCRHCNVFHKPQWDGLTKLGLAHLPGDSKTSLYLPFWRIQADVEQFELTSFADLVKVANLTKPVGPKDQERTFYFWVPAFRVDSHLFLQIAKHVTLCQPQGELVRTIPDVASYPVNLHMSEALKSLKTVFADFVALKEKNYPLLEDIAIKPKRIALVFLPFQKMGSEVVNLEYRVQVNRRLLEHYSTTPITDIG
ncbi:hypothetical protein ACFL4N_05585 [Thermodesulfobacteriota bacterium]